VVRTALSTPGLVKKLALMDPGLPELVAAIRPAPAENVAVTRARATEAFYRKGDIEGGLEYFFDDVNGKGAWKKLPEAQRQIRLDNAWTVVGQAGDVNVKPLTCSDIGTLKMPVLLMTGEKSPPQYGPILDAFQRCQPAAARVAIPNAAHQMSQHNPPAFNAALIKFMTE
jgi:pimeloyl-ACP methyl ester carboxylesterase